MHVEIEFYLSDTSIQKALEAGVAVTEIMGSLLDRISEPALATAIRNNDIDPADALRQLQAQGCLEQHSQNFDIWQWIVPSAHAASCIITTLPTASRRAYPFLKLQFQSCFNCSKLSWPNEKFVLLPTT